MNLCMPEHSPWRRFSPCCRLLAVPAAQSARESSGRTRSSSKPSSTRTTMASSPPCRKGPTLTQGRPRATPVKHWGEEKIKNAVAKHLGEITGYLLGMEVEQSGYANVGMFFRITGPDGVMRQIITDFVDSHGRGGPHIDFQGEAGKGLALSS